MDKYRCQHSVYQKCNEREYCDCDGIYYGNDCVCARENDKAADEPTATNFQRYFSTPERAANIMLPLMPTMEGFCPYCPHWKDNACEVNPKWDCKPGLIEWLNTPAGDNP